VLPDFIGKLTKLEFLHLSNNFFTVLSDFIGKLSQLQELNFSNNHLTEIPDSIGRLPELLNLNLSNNGFNKIKCFLINGKEIQISDEIMKNFRLSKVTEFLAKEIGSELGKGRENIKNIIIFYNDIRIDNISSFFRNDDDNPVFTIFCS
jgi:Leucine-rich repeat (LRR) protein